MKSWALALKILALITFSALVCGLSWTKVTHRAGRMSLLHAKATTLERAQRKFRERGDISDAQGMDGDYLDFAEALSDIRDQMAFSSPAVAGQLVTGRILTVDDKGATLDFGGKMPAYLPVRELSLQSIRSALRCVSIGQEVTGEVLGFVRGVPIVSLRGIQLEEAWDRVAELARKELSFDVTILDVNEVSMPHAELLCLSFSLCRSSRAVPSRSFTVCSASCRVLKPSVLSMRHQSARM